MTRRPHALHLLVIALVLLAPVALLAFAGATLQAAPQAAPPATTQASPSATVTVKNPIALARPSETIVLEAAAIRAAITADDLRKVHVTDIGSGKEVLAQAVDLDDDGAFDQVIFQADLAASATRTFALAVGERQVYTKDQFKAYGRFVRERRDDFAWENDRTAHRMYGKALETWAQEPLTSSTVDVWFKRTRRLVINEWYMVDDYHRDTGDGADMYSAGRVARLRRKRDLGRREAVRVAQLRRVPDDRPRPDPRDVRADVPGVGRQREDRDRDEDESPSTPART